VLLLGFGVSVFPAQFRAALLIIPVFQSGGPGFLALSVYYLSMVIALFFPFFFLYLPSGYPPPIRQPSADGFCLFLTIRDGFGVRRLPLVFPFGDGVIRPLRNLRTRDPILTNNCLSMAALLVGFSPAC